MSCVAQIVRRYRVTASANLRRRIGRGTGVRASTERALTGIERSRPRVPPTDRLTRHRRFASHRGSTRRASTQFHGTWIARDNGLRGRWLSRCSHISMGRTCRNQNCKEHNRCEDYNQDPARNLRTRGHCHHSSPNPVTTRTDRGTVCIYCVCKLCRVSVNLAQTP